MAKTKAAAATAEETKPKRGRPRKTDAAVKSTVIGARKPTDCNPWALCSRGYASSAKAPQG